MSLGLPELNKAQFDVTMSSTSNGKSKEEIEEPKGEKIECQDSVHISTSKRELLTHDISQKTFQTTLNTFPRRLVSLKFDSAAVSLASPSARFRRIAEEKDEISRSVQSPSSQGYRVPLSGVVIPKINLGSVKKLSKEWIRNPLNMALVVWFACVAVSGTMLFLIMTGMLNHVLPRKSQRNGWCEVNNQILNALSTLMCLYQHPKLFHHIILLCRWKPEDISRLRKIYCKSGTYKPHEWAHMLVVVLILHLNGFAQYALCGLNLGYKRSKRPAIGVGICVAVGIAAPAIAGVYYIFSPLAREYDTNIDEEAQVQIIASENDRPNQLRLKSFQKRFSFVSRHDQKIVENKPVWRGGVLDFWDDISVAYLSLCCSVCVFGWNMERLGFGNMYVHIATFVLFCTAPFWIFNLAAINIDHESIREALGVTGIVLCCFGLLYGGFWRIQMRKRFNLPPNNICFGNPAVADCAQWFCCCWCSLAQEVRTGNFYDIVEEKFCRKPTAEVSPLPCTDGEPESSSACSDPIFPVHNSLSPNKIMRANTPSPSRFSKGNYSPQQLPMVGEVEVSPTTVKDEAMTPPAILLIQKEAN